MVPKASQRQAQGKPKASHQFGSFGINRNGLAVTYSTFSAAGAPHQEPFCCIGVHYAWYVSVGRLPKQELLQDCTQNCTYLALENDMCPLTH